ncbi:MAG: 1-aminocyclopropane-carboxylate deaminase [Flavipsychrobacter sp.]|jgi:1-aminocyclopropane-1-carboxylate deaminase|nr:1-aminocyclopropane-carboxylate deaminase [Flavipsychrobacter sp.]
MGIIDERLAVIQPLNKFWHGNKVAALDMLRLDLLHPVVSGNKWFKLRLNMQHAVDKGYKAIVTPGGGWSNHLAATAFAAKAFGIRAIGVVRGKYNVLTPTLEACKANGMELVFVSQEDYNNKHEPGWARSLVAHFDEVFMIPEGGANEWGRKGAGLISRFINDTYTHIAVAVGTGTTMIGLRDKLNTHQQMLGFVPMKQGAYLEGYIRNHVQSERDRNWQLTDEWHFGGFGKWDKELLDFMNDFYVANQIPLDIVYTSKMMYGIREMLHRNSFSSHERILCIHSGGLQGNASVRELLCY